MEFKLDRVTTCFDENEIETVESLKKIGFTFEFYPDAHNTWQITNEPIITINTLEELKELCSEYGDIIIRDDFGTIKIYDDWE